MTYLDIARRWWRKVGPYVVLEIVLPGGTLFALLLFLYRRSKRVRPLMRQRVFGFVPALARAGDSLPLCTR